MKPKAMKIRLKKEMAKIAASRDVLRDLESEAAQLADICDEALEGLEQAVDRLSELV